MQMSSRFEPAPVHHTHLFLCISSQMRYNAHEKSELDVALAELMRVPPWCNRNVAEPAFSLSQMFFLFAYSEDNLTASFLMLFSVAGISLVFLSDFRVMLSYGALFEKWCIIFVARGRDFLCEHVFNTLIFNCNILKI